MSRPRYASVWLACLVQSCSEPISPAIGPATLPDSPVVATVGGEPLTAAEVGPIAALMRDLRRRLDLLASADETDLSLAIELLSLAKASQSLPADDLTEERRRLLARVFLHRALAEVDREPVTDEDLEQVLAREISRTWAFEESPIYKPTMIDVVVISVGFLPDWSPPEAQDVPPLLDRDGVLRLVTELRAVLGDRAPDLDGLLAIVRRFEPGHPTLRVWTPVRVTRDPRWSSLAPPLHAALLALAAPGDVSPIVWLENGAVILRRGPTYPGRGETIDEAREALTRFVVADRRRAALDVLHSSLQSRLAIEVYPERLAELQGKAPKP